MTPSPLIQARGLSIGYRSGRREHVVRHGLSFVLEPGTLTALLGLNGSGKSTLLRTLAGAQPPLAGEILLDGRPLGGHSPGEISRRIGLVLTDKTSAAGLRVRELVALGRQPYSGFFGVLKAGDHAVVDRSMERAGIAHKAERYLGELSDGERQKAMIARALAQECPVILLDEPTAFLDVVSRVEVIGLLGRLARQEGKSILLSTHEVEAAARLADRLWLMERAGGMTAGPTGELVAGGEVRRIFSPVEL